VLVTSEQPSHRFELAGHAAAPVDLPVRTRHFDLALYFRERDDTIELAIDYATGLFDAWRIEALCDHLANAATAVASDPAMPVQAVGLLSADERRMLEVGYNETRTDYPRDASITALFAEQARRRPEALAVQPIGEAPLSYRDLNRHSDALAARLAASGAVGPGSLVGIAAQRSAAFIVGIVGILKAGAAYVPIDLAYPAARAAAMLSAAPLAAVLTDDAALALPSDCVRLPLSDSAETTDSRVGLPHVGRAGPHDTAYVMFTSGTTGKPKAVAVPHRAVLRLVLGTDYVSLGPDDRLLQTGALSFDAATFEIWGMLLNGGALVLPSTTPLQSRWRNRTLPPSPPCASCSSAESACRPCISPPCAAAFRHYAC
jgi:non-ribosomal peptide synthetase component F